MVFILIIRTYFYICPSVENVWTKINSEEVCFETKDKRFGSFYPRKSGNVTAFKLIHLSEKVSCYPEGESNWGCGLFPNDIMVVITDENNQLVVPHSPSWSHQQSRRYALAGFNLNSPFIDLETGSPYYLRHDSSLRVWYGEDLGDFTTSDNIGKACIDVYAQYKENIKGKTELLVLYVHVCITIYNNNNNNNINSLLKLLQFETELTS